MGENLRPELARFRRQLGVFPDENANELGPMVRRMASAIGRLSHAMQSGVDPDGVDGVDRLGEYHRLLTSEWLLADEFPDEFLRRAAMKEHLFLRLARQEPKGGRRTLVFFDSGPLQLGSPRLVHLVLLLALKTRAEEAGADFYWTCLQRPEVEGIEADEIGIRTLLQGASAELASEEHVQSALARQDAPQEGDDIWWVGDEGFVTTEQLPGSRISITDELLIEGDRLKVVVRQNNTERSLFLDLPESNVRTRLMRDPFEEFRPRGEPLDVRGNRFWFSSCAKYVFVRTETGVHCLSSSAQGRWPKFFPNKDQAGQLVAVNRFKKDFARLVRDGGNYALKFERYGDLKMRFSGRNPQQPLPGTGLWPLFVAGKRARRAVLIDSAGSLFVGQADGDGIDMRPVLDGATHMFWRRGYIAAVCQSKESLAFHHLGLDFRLTPSGWGDGDGVRLVQAYDSNTQRGVLAFEQRQSATEIEARTVPPGFELWAVRGATPASHKLRSTLEVVTLRQLGANWYPVVLSENRRELRVEATNSSQVLASFEEPVERYAVADTRGLIAVEVGGQLRVVDLEAPSHQSQHRLELPEPWAGSDSSGAQP